MQLLRSCLHSTGSFYKIYVVDIEIAVVPIPSAAALRMLAGVQVSQFDVLSETTDDVKIVLPHLRDRGMRGARRCAIFVTY